MLDQIFLGDAAGTTGAGDIGRVYIVASGVIRGARRERTGVHFAFSRSGRFSGFRHSDLSSSRGRSRCGGNSAFLDHGDDLRAGDGGAGFEFDFLQNAIDRRGYFQHDLVGFQIDEVFIAAYAVADFLVPGGDDGVGNGFGQDGDFDFNAHDCGLFGYSWVKSLLPGLVRASAINWFCSAAWVLAWPQAGAAERARPA